MKNMTLSAIAKACGGQLLGDNNCTGREVAGVGVDSRKVGKDFLFVATVGERVDGHNFIDDVFDKGAMAVVCEKIPIDPKGPCILVESSFAALKDIAKWYRMQLDVKVVGITGSVGKTSSKEFIRSVVAQKYNVLATEGNFNNEVGLPLTILKIRDDHEIAVLEMGISDFGEMHRLSEIAKPDICVITNIGQCHLENLESRQGVLKAKTEIFDFMNEDGRVCLNGDDDMLATIQEVKGIKPTRFGMSNNNDVYATDVISKGLFGSICEIHINDSIYQANDSIFRAKDSISHSMDSLSHSKDSISHSMDSLSYVRDSISYSKVGTFHTNIPLPGEHMILNALAATSVGTLLDMTCGEITAGIEAVRPVGGRSNIIRQEQWIIIDDCYNANPVSMKAAIDLLCMANTNKIAILGDMGELGNSENDLHKEVGVYAAVANIDVLVCVGKLSSNMYNGAVNTFKGKLLYFKTIDELLEALPTIVKKDDTILVKASHKMGFENVVKALLK